MIGRRIGHYRITRKLGEGGMGSVYLAEDLSLDRLVALKFIRPDRQGADFTARLLREARLAAAVSHPFICSIFSIDEFEDGPFIVMEYVSGRTLAERLRSSPSGLDETVELGCQLADALEAAHRHGIVHRDLKPANIMLTEGGHIKVMDFGLALQPALPKDKPDETALAEAGQIVGTPTYMSPEQLRGEPPDWRSDIFAFGIILYEMATGTHPFRASTAADTAVAILSEEPAEASQIHSRLPGPLAPLVSQLLVKDTSKRDMKAIRVLHELRAIGASRGSHEAAAEESVAVLPFRDLSASQDQTYFCDGVAEELIAVLSRHPGLRVVARGSAFRFRDGDLSAEEISHHLGVDLLVDGSVQKGGDRLRVTTHLVRGRDGSELWSERYEGDAQDIFRIQDEIAAAVSKRLEKDSAGAGQDTGVPFTSNVAAHDLYLKARHHWNRRTGEDLRASLDLLRQATELDPDFAMAHVALGDTFLMLGTYGDAHPDEIMSAAREAADRALQISPNLSEALTIRGHVEAVYDWRWQEAERTFRTAARHNASNAQALQWLASTVLWPEARFAEAGSLLIRARQLDPLSPAIDATYGFGLHLEGRTAEAAVELERLVAGSPEFSLAHLFLGRVRIIQGDLEEALTALDRAQRLAPGSREIAAARYRAQALAGQLSAARQGLVELQQRPDYVSPVLLAQIHLALGDTEACFDALRRGLEVRSADLIWIGVRPAFAELRGHPDFARICGQLQLETETIG